MLREIPAKDLEKLYKNNDLVKADAGGCRGCHKCCTGMGNSIVLDPYDANRLSAGLSRPFAEIREAEWTIQEYILLPNLRMVEKTDACAFLNAEGRCSVHEFRPGLCRLFPLGRVYEEEDFHYFLQSGECPKTNRKNVKVRKWLGEPEIESYEAFILSWRELLKELREKLSASSDRSLNTRVLSFFAKLFYLEPYEKEQDFYVQFELRKVKMEKLIQTIEW